MFDVRSPVSRPNGSREERPQTEGVATSLFGRMTFRTLLSVPASIADDPCASDAEVGGLVDVPMDPEVGTLLDQQVLQLLAVALSEMGVPVRQAVRMRGVMRDDDRRPVVGPREIGIEERPCGPMHQKDVGELDAIARARPRPDMPVIDHAIAPLR
ncbi:MULTISPECIES: hypothetical protein [unclassified Methylobacterium]|uniref:hypothetical protein n=2 Tax=Methylobacterium TaxID=407 RepID=UPI001114F93C|nr:MULTISPECIES: hypothetical protein [unclassified Methylobacterium]